MSAPEDRLLGDVDAERMRAAAMEALFYPHPLSLEIRQLAACIIVFATDRQARIELAAAQHNCLAPQSRG